MTATGPERNTRVFAGLGCGVFAVACLLLSGYVAIEGYREYQSLPKLVDGVESQIDAPALESLTVEQQTVRTTLGSPEAFTILFYEEEMEDGTFGDVRFETWSYYSDGVEYTFINGELVAEDPLVIDLGELIQIPYTPEQFRAYMSLDEVIASAGLDAFMVVPLEKELVEGGEDKSSQFCRGSAWPWR